MGFFFHLNVVSKAATLEVWSRKLRVPRIFSEILQSENYLHSNSKTLFVFFTLTSTYGSFPEAPLHVKSQETEYKSKYDNPGIFYQDKHYRNLYKSKIMPLYSLTFFLENIVIFIKICYLYLLVMSLFFNMLIYF